MSELNIPGYRIVKLLGEGGMGSVYLAEHVIMGKQRAIKVLQSQWSQDRDQVTRFFNEARAASSLEHDNIITIHDCGQLANGQCFIVMDFLKGCDLTAYWEEQGRLLTEHETLRYTSQIANALTHAHAHGIVHRDLKPDNIFLTARGDDDRRPILLDFGIAKLHDPTTSAPLTRAGQAFGTPYYMAPEQMDDASSVDVRADVYALAVIVYQLRTGRLPFEGTSLQAVYHAQRTTRMATDPRAYNPAMSAEWAEILMRGLAFEPSNRTATPSALAVELARATTAHDQWPDGMSVIGHYAKPLLSMSGQHGTVAPALSIPSRGGDTAPARPRVLSEVPRSTAASQTPQAAAISVPPSARRSRGSLLFAIAIVTTIGIGTVLFAMKNAARDSSNGISSPSTPLTDAPATPLTDATQASASPNIASSVDASADRAVDAATPPDARPEVIASPDAMVPDTRPHHRSSQRGAPHGSGSSQPPSGTGSDFDPDDVGGH